MNCSMMRLFYLIIFFLFIKNGTAQVTLNKDLKAELDSMIIVDQKYRTLIGLAYAGKEDSLASVLNLRKEDLITYLWAKQSLLDSTNLIRVNNILNIYGYPGKSQVGDSTNEVVFYILQHSNEIAKYLPVIKEAAEKEELSFYLYAMMFDRYLMYADKEQEYGTQITGFDVKDADTKQITRVWVIWPVRDPVGVNERRRKAGFIDTIEEYAKRKGFAYKPLTLEQLKTMQQ